MLKKALLTTLLSLSSLATAQVSLELNLLIQNQTIEHNTSGTVIIDENIATSVVFNGFESLVFDLLTNQENNEVIIQVQILQKTDNDNDELVKVTNPLIVRVPFGQPATITVNEESADTDNNGSLILTITPSLIE